MQTRWNMCLMAKSVWMALWLALLYHNYWALVTAYVHFFSFPSVHVSFLWVPWFPLGSLDASHSSSLLLYYISPCTQCFWEQKHVIYAIYPFLWVVSGLLKVCKLLHSHHANKTWPIQLRLGSGCTWNRAEPHENKPHQALINRVCVVELFMWEQRRNYT